MQSQLWLCLIFNTKYSQLDFNDGVVILCGVGLGKDHPQVLRTEEARAPVLVMCPAAAAQRVRESKKVAATQPGGGVIFVS